MTFLDDYMQILNDSRRLSLDCVTGNSSFKSPNDGRGRATGSGGGSHSDRNDSSSLLEPVAVPTEGCFSPLRSPASSSGDESGSGIDSENDNDEVDDFHWLASKNEVWSMRGRDFREKELWFQAKCNVLEVERRRSTAVRIKVRAGYLLDDAMDTVLRMRPNQLRKAWNIELEGERVKNKDRLAQEWFALVTETVCDVKRGLWRSSKVEDVGLQINPWSGMIDADHLVWFRFLGRIMGKALFDGHKIPNQIIPYIYKFLVGAPLTLLDLKQCDRRYYDVVKSLENMDDLSDLGMNFTLTEEDPFGGERYVELIPGGSDVQLTKNNLDLYKESLIRYLLADRIKPQLMELFAGFHEVVPKRILSVLESHELEILMCGSLGISHLQVPE